MIDLESIFPSETTKIIESIDNGNKNIFIEVGDDFLKEQIIELLKKKKTKKQEYLIEKLTDYDSYLNSLQNKLKDIFKTMTRGVSFSINEEKGESRKTNVLKYLEYLSRYVQLNIIIENLEESKKSLINLVEDMSIIFLELKTVTIIFGNPKRYSNENIDEISRIKKSKNFELIHFKNLGREHYENILVKDYALPLDILYDIYERSGGAIDYTYAQLSILKSKGYIDENGKWLKGNRIPDEIPRSTSDLISYRYRMLDDNKRDVLRWLSMFDDYVEIELIERISGLNKSLFINALEGLNELDMINIKDNLFYFEDLNLKRHIESSISQYSKISMSKIILDNINESSHEYLKFLINAEEYKKAEEIILKNTVNISGKNVNNYQEMIQLLLKHARSERLLRRYARILLFKGYKEEARTVLNEIEKNYAEPSSGFYALKAWSSDVEDIETLDDYYEKANDPIDKEWILYYKMYYLWQLGRNEEAIKVSEKLLREIKSEQVKGEVFRLLGNIALDADDIDKALNYYKMSKDIAERIGDYRNLTRIFGNISNIYFIHEQEEEGFNYLYMAKNLARENFDIPAYVINDYNLTIMEYDYQRISFDEMTEKLEKMENIILKYGSDSFIQNFLLTLSSVYLFSLQLEKYTEYIKKAEKEATGKGNKFQIARMEYIKTLEALLRGENISVNRKKINPTNALDYVVIKLLQSDIDEADSIIKLLPDEIESKYYVALIRIMKGENPENLRNEIGKFISGRRLYSIFLNDLLNFNLKRRIDYNKYIETGNDITLIIFSRLLSSEEKGVIRDMIKERRGIDLTHLIFME